MVDERLTSVLSLGPRKLFFLAADQWTDVFVFVFVNIFMQGMSRKITGNHNKCSHRSQREQLMYSQFAKILGYLPKIIIATMTLAIPGRAVHQEGIRRQRGVIKLTRSQERRAALVLWMHRSSAVRRVPPSGFNWIQ